MKRANTTLALCMDKLKTMAKAEIVYTDEIPEVLQEDFKTFIIGKTLGTYFDREITYDLRAYIDKLTDKGIDYYVSWDLQELCCIEETAEFVESLLKKYGLQFYKTAPGYWFRKDSFKYQFVCDTYLFGEILETIGKHEGWHK